MRKIYLLLFLFCFSFVSFLSAQVGIGTTSPNAQFDIRSSSQVAPLNTDGILIPKVDVFPATNPTAAQQGMLVYLTTPTTFGGNPKPIGFYYWNNSPADWIGISSAVSGDHDWYEVGTTTPPNAITDDMFHTGNVAIGKNTANYPLDISTSTSFININTTSTYSGGSDVYAMSNNILSASDINKTGILNNISSNNLGIMTGVDNQLSSNQDIFNFGTKNTLFGSSNDTTKSRIGTINSINVNGDISQIGTANNITGTGTSNTALRIGVSNTLSGTSSTQLEGTRNEISSSGTGRQTGTYNYLTGSGSSVTNSHYGVYNQLTGTGTANKYGTYNIINTTAGGNHYGVYSSVLKAGTTNFAGYFLGNVSIGTTALNNYIFPASRGLNGQVIKTDGLGNLSWANNSDFSWSTSGNSGTNGGNTTTTGTNFLGTTDNQNVDIRTNNTFRARFSNLGEFFVGTLNTVITGDLMNAVSNAAFPWAINGYSDQNGAGVYGQITAGSTAYAGVQGETLSNATNAAGIRGIDLANSPGTSFTNVRSGVSGNTVILGGTSSYKFGVYGNGGQAIRTGGVMGNDFGTRGGLGYFSSGLIDYSVYGFGLAYQTGAAAGRFSSANHNNFLGKNTNIGLGIYGGVMGGWVRGMKYGFHTKGETYSLYVDGNGYTNKPITYLIESDDNQKVASFMTSSIKPEITVNGKTNLQNGKVFVSFDKNFSKVISSIDDIVITATPQGKSNGVYIDEITKEGFWIIENNDGTSNVKISWIAITKIKGEENPEVPSDLLTNDFDKKMDKVMFNENNTSEEAQSLWWDGTKIRWDKLNNDKKDTQTEVFARPKLIKK